MTCVECKFQWCWLCQKEYKYGHYDSGSCRGLQFEKEQDEEKIKQMLERNLKLYPALPPRPALPYRRPLPPRRRRRCHCFCTCMKHIFVFLLFIFLSPYFFFFKLISEDYYINCCAYAAYMGSVVPAFIAFEVFFFAVNIIFILPGLICFRAFRDFYIHILEIF